MNEPQEIVFYDGECGLCHRFVKTTLARDRAGVFHFAPLQGSTFTRLVAEPERAALPDSVVVRTRKGRLLSRSAAVLYVLRRLGGSWGVLARALGLIPRPVRDWFYDVIAGARGSMFARPQGLCPVVPEELRARLLE